MSLVTALLMFCFISNKARNKKGVVYRISEPLILINLTKGTFFVRLESAVGRDAGSAEIKVSMFYYLPSVAVLIRACTSGIFESMYVFLPLAWR